MKIFMNYIVKRSNWKFSLSNLLAQKLRVWNGSVFSKDWRHYCSFSGLRC